MLKKLLFLTALLNSCVIYTTNVKLDVTVKTPTNETGQEFIITYDEDTKVSNQAEFVSDEVIIFFTVNNIDNKFVTILLNILKSDIDPETHEKKFTGHTGHGIYAPWCDMYGYDSKATIAYDNSDATIIVEISKP